MVKLKIYHNPRCFKSRETLKLLKDLGHEPEIKEYLKEPMNLDELEDLLKKLDMKADELIRKEEKDFKELKKKHGYPDEDSAKKWMIKNPKLIQRPIVVKGDKAKLGRPPKSVKDILED